MKDFKENNCRLCKKVFCCKTCREKHEKEVHRIHSDCNICIYGTTASFLGSPSLIEHIKTVHWPLHCLICKRLFGSVEELFQHSKCPLSIKITDDLEKSPYGPGQSKFIEQSYDSPPLSLCIYERSQSNNNVKGVCNLATSTPMQKEDNHLLVKIQQVIVTPVDSESGIITNSITKTNSKDNITGSLKKRRVTFGDTIEHTGTSYNQSQFNQRSMSSQDYSQENFYSAKEDQSSHFESHQNENINVDLNLSNHVKESPQNTQNVAQNNIDDPDEKSSLGDDTVWTSAINKSASSIEGMGSPSWEASTIPESKMFTTPMFPYYKKKQVNIVMPTPLKIREEISIKFLAPIQISSTPNSSIIPVKSAPNHREVFRSEEAASSKSEVDSLLMKKHQQTIVVSDETTESFRDTEETGEYISSASDNSIHGRLWSSVSRIVKNVTSAFNGFSSIDGIALPKQLHSMKRQYSDYDYLEEPSVKRYKLTEIKCRRTIRELPVSSFSRNSIEKTREVHDIEKEERKEHIAKILIDKATQTDDIILK